MKYNGHREGLSAGRLLAGVVVESTVVVWEAGCR
jgi:hypothetical protein